MANEFTISGSTFTVASVAAYASASDVSNLCRNLLGPNDNFGTSTSPTLTAVNGWLSSGCAVLESKIADMGYAIPVSSTTVLYSWLTDLNALYAASRAEMSRSNVTLGPGERTRGQVFDEMFWKQLKQLETINLVSLGATRLTPTDSVGLFVGGISQANKDLMVDDTDVVQARFKRAMFDMVNTED